MILPRERSGYPAPEGIAAARAASAAAVAQRRWVTKRPVESATIGTVEVLRVLPEGGALRGRMIHFHGGGFRMGLPEMDAPFAEALADRCGIEVVLPRYRLAPENPFPAGLNDALEVMWGTMADLPFIISGNSAGGGIAASLALLGRDEGRKMAGLALHSPWLDLTTRSPAYRDASIADPLFSKDSATTASELFLQGHPADDPCASPLLGRLEGLPPVLTTVGMGEFLYDNATRFHAALEAAGVPSHLLAVEGMEHVAISRSPDAQGAAEAFAATVDFIEVLLA